MQIVVSFTVTITDHTKPAQNLYDLMTLGAGGTLAGYTVVGGTQALAAFGNVGYRSIQAAIGNTGSIYIGDSFTGNDGSRQGLVLAKGDVWDRDDYGSPINLNGVYVRCGTDGDKFSVMVETA